jgi:peptidoglycan/xylan/chitin deacetylase (PgdA/CDA1 family)
MNLPIVKPSQLAEMAFPKFTWRVAGDTKIYLTFDDGPIPEVTEWVLDTLASFNIKATFFCVGENVVKYPEIFKKILDANHSVGNHTFNHLNSWKTDNTRYIENIALASEVIDSKLFRPPYGKIRPSVTNKVLRTHKTIMWDVLSRDYDQDLTPEECCEIVLKKVSKGSIIVFHDSLKAEKNLRYALPKSIEQLLERGFEFDKLAMV